MSTPTHYGGVPIVLIRQGTHTYPVAPDLTDEHDHPGSNDTTVHDLGTGSAEFSTIVRCASESDFAALLNKRRSPQSFTGGGSWYSGSWSMTVEGNSAEATPGRFAIRARFKRV
jgi:hypothetical protein